MAVICVEMGGREKVKGGRKGGEGRGGEEGGLGSQVTPNTPHVVIT